MRTLWIGFCALAMLVQTGLLFSTGLPSPWLAGFVLGGAVFAYYFMHPDKTRRYLARGMGGVALLGFIAMPATARWVALAPLLLWLLYYGFKKPGRAGLRALPLLKPLAISLAWAWVTVLLPLEPFRWDSAVVLLLGRSAFIFALALAYDLTDLEYDRRQGLRTLALNLGVQRSFRLIDLVLSASALCVLVNYGVGRYSIWAGAALTGNLALSGFLLRKIVRQGGAAWQKFWIDGLMIAQLGMVAAGELFIAN
ncbi:MAG: hypothetical protein U0U46_06530 [Saprospiraceae bacterium]